MISLAASRVLSTGLALIWACQSHGQTRAATRSPSPGAEKTEVPERAKRLVELNAWLGRLVGHFDVVAKSPPGPQAACAGHADNRAGAACTLTSSYEGPPPPQYSGRAECRSVDAAHGLSCSFTWRVVRSPFTHFLPAIMLVGMDPDTLDVRYLQVNNEGLAFQAIGSQKGNVANLSRECASRACQAVTWSITARAANRPVELLIRPDTNRLNGVTDDRTQELRRLSFDLAVTMRRAKR